jgi:hypothetical protein
MSIQTQHYLVYLIVFSAALKLLQPILILIYKKILYFQNPKVKEDPYSFYTPVCSKCGMKEKKSTFEK